MNDLPRQSLSNASDGDPMDISAKTQSTTRSSRVPSVASEDDGELTPTSTRHLPVNHHDSSVHATESDDDGDAGIDAAGSRATDQSLPPSRLGSDSPEPAGPNHSSAAADSEGNSDDPGARVDAKGTNIPRQGRRPPSNPPGGGKDSPRPTAASNGHVFSASSSSLVSTLTPTATSVGLTGHAISQEADTGNFEVQLHRELRRVQAMASLDRYRLSKIDILKERHTELRATCGRISKELELANEEQEKVGVRLCRKQGILEGCRDEEIASLQSAKRKLIDLIDGQVSKRRHPT
ncbi:MAG: hypothetical protein LQ341_000997 [Variospora aurantia]|nr:MAG: hypothetical protein LQ341_000997 [Variospora aurantia]